MLQLLDHRADVNAQENDGWTPLMFAANNVNYTASWPKLSLEFILQSLNIYIQTMHIGKHLIMPASYWTFRSLL